MKADGVRIKAMQPDGVAQVVDHLAQLLLGLVGTGDVGPPDGRGRVRFDLGRARARDVLHEHEYADD